jgi:hypothetical protein
MLRLTQPSRRPRSSGYSVETAQLSRERTDDSRDRTDDSRDRTDDSRDRTDNSLLLPEPDTPDDTSAASLSLARFGGSTTLATTPSASAFRLAGVAAYAHRNRDSGR